ncbi:lipoprotein [Bacillus timonensis]|nr:lipoprotein [Bacillus timonensis]
MKKYIVLLFVTIFVLSGCSLDDGCACSEPEPETEEND